MTATSLASEGTDAPSHYLIDAEGVTIQSATPADIQERIDAGRFFWLDLVRIGKAEAGWLRDLFHFHPLAVEDAVEFGQRPKVEEYDDFTFLVLYGSASDAGASIYGDPNAVDPTPLRASSDHLIDSFGDVAEIHFFVAKNFLVTVHGADCGAFVALHKRLRDRGRGASKDPTRLLYLVADTLVDSFFPVLSALDDHIDDLEDQVISKPETSQLEELLDFKRALIGLRKVVVPQRDLFASLASAVVQIPGMDAEAQRYLRDVYDHLIRLTDQLDSYRDLLAGTTDAYLSVTSNQLNVVMKQLAVISTIFLPLSFLTGFFGQNFGWMVNHIGSWQAFVAIGVGVDLATVAGLLALFKRRGWF